MTLGEAVLVTHAVVDRLARDARVRALFIKGPILAAQGLTPARGSVDVDVLVDPARKADLELALGAHGWSVAVPPTSAQIMALHSSTFRHPDRPCEIDLHDRYPGFLADPEQVFGVLWARQTTVHLATRDLSCCDWLAHSMIAALHALRDPELGRSRADLDHLVAALEARLDDGSRAELARLAEDTGCVETLRPFLARLEVRTGTVGTANPTDLLAWHTRAASTGVRTVPWLVELSRTPLCRLPGRLVHAFLLTEAEIRQAQPQAAPGAWGLFLARLRRLRWGLRDLPRAARIVLQARRSA